MGNFLDSRSAANGLPGTSSVGVNPSYQLGQFYFNTVSTSGGDRSGDFDLPWDYFPAGNATDLAFELTYTPVPESSSLSLLAIGLFGMIVLAWQRG